MVVGNVFICGKVFDTKNPEVIHPSGTSGRGWLRLLNHVVWLISTTAFTPRNILKKMLQIKII